MYGSQWLTIGGVLLGGLLVIALFVAASPLFAVIVALVVAVPIALLVSAGRRAREGESDRAPAQTPEGRPTSPTGSRSKGAPASGEG
jgi:hypothetical protein